ncbi:hypothetical protein M3697_11735 [Janibacter melonis]|uniref:hypothetical protein n=1 Tax=Janibacter melonis TaxID=262209 RepID=UPI002044026B|nr:hypothetical protein [Janibacter melonis]MCM3555775.1 hypothetical protein [Janibacter melonis]
MGLTRILAHLAVNSARVLIVEAPGHWLTRVELEQQMLLRGWCAAWTPADADVLAVCGVPGPELVELAQRLWEQMPGPRVRVDVASSAVVGSALEDAAALLLDTPYHRADARERAQEPRIPEDHGQMGHEGMNHEGMDHGGHEGMNHEAMDHEGMDHAGHGGHGGMDMAPAGIALAQGGQDRDGLEMDVLHLPLGPVLPFWPAGLVLCCSLQGDVVVDAAASVVDGAGQAAGSKEPQAPPVPASAVRCDGVMALLALAGADDAAARARRARDALVRGDQGAARDVVERLHRTVRRSWLLRWSLRGVLVLDPSDLARHGLPEGCRGDAHDRLSSMVEGLRSEVCGGAVPAAVESGAVPWERMPHLVTGLELATVRLAVASLNLEPFSTVQETGHA